MKRDISQLIIWGDVDSDNTLNKHIDALEILEHFWEKEKERWIVIMIWWIDTLGMHTAHLLATTLTHKDMVFAQTNMLDAVILDHMMLEQRPEPTMENLIKQIWDDLQKQMTMAKDSIDTYKVLQEADIAQKKEQEKRRRRHLHNKKISTKKKG